jgi:phosphate transport system protein
MISDMERIGDQASDIAEITKYIVNNETKSRVHIADMAKATIKMVTDSIESYVKKDLEMARSVIEYDDVVDDLFDEVKKELIGLIGKDSSLGEMCIDLLMIAKYFERIGDHAVNIGEWVEFSLTGKHAEKDKPTGVQ